MLAGISEIVLYNLTHDWTVGGICLSSQYPLSLSFKPDLWPNSFKDRSFIVSSLFFFLASVCVYKYLCSTVHHTAASFVSLALYYQHCILHECQIFVVSLIFFLTFKSMCQLWSISCEWNLIIGIGFLSRFWVIVRAQVRHLMFIW